MRLTQRLLGALNRVWSRDPVPFLAFRLTYDGPAMTWTVQDGMFTTVVTGGSGTALAVDLSTFSVVGLVSFLAAQPGYTLTAPPAAAVQNLCALVLLDGSGASSDPNGDRVQGYTSILWSFAEAAAYELQVAAAAIVAMPLEMATTTADGWWLDLLGGFYAVPRLAGELDAPYGRRIIAETLLPRVNNVAMEAAILSYTGQQTSVVDVVRYVGATQLHDGSFEHDGSHLHSGTTAVAQHCLFDVTTGYDLENGGSITAFAAVVTALVERLRAAGAHLRALTLTGSQLTDTVTLPGDLGDTLVLTRGHFRDGRYSYNSAIDHSGSTVTVSSLTG